jgi:predicted short-subunit dehydrogenase-like oxidoreductase (DUF2520 family)
MDVGVVGAGRVGTALAVLLGKAGHRIVGASGREASRARVERFLPDVPLLEPSETASRAEVVVLAVPDDHIAETCADLVATGVVRAGHAVLHLSGSVSLDALEPARIGRATVLSLHPLQTFPTVEAAVERLPGSAMAVTAWSEKGVGLGERLASDVGGRPFQLADENKPLYHAAAVFCSNYLAVLVALSERLFGLAGIEDPVSLFAPLARAALDNGLELGPGTALTGPAVRGDGGTIRRNLEALTSHAPEAIPAYVALARAALDVAERSGRLDRGRRGQVEEVLARWR